MFIDMPHIYTIMFRIINKQEKKFLLVHLKKIYRVKKQL